MNTGRKITGGKYHANRKKKHYEQSGHERTVTLKERKAKQVRTRGGARKTVLLGENVANVIVDGKTQRAEIQNVVETPQNVFLARQNRLIKGAIIQTSLGKAKITNRPGQEGVINATLVKE